MDYNIDGFNIPCSSVCKDLGVTFSNDLSWKNIMKLWYLRLTNHLAYYVKLSVKLLFPGKTAALHIYG